MDDLRPRSVLLLEDEPFIALDIEDILTDAGFRNITVLSSRSEAAEWLISHTPDVAILDPHLKDGVCDDIAKTLVSRTVPFLVYSGGLPETAGNGFLRGGRWLPKPALPQAIVSELRASFSAG